MTTTQHNFSPMRGHCYDGSMVQCDNGDVLTIRSTIYGWKLLNAKNEQVGDLTHDSGIITLYVIGYGQ